MKNSIYTLFAFLFAVSALIPLQTFAQAPQKMSYQLVVRNANNELITNSAVGMRIQILQGSESGASVYAETHTPQTNANGLVSLEIGGGTVVSGIFADINWAIGPYFIKTETDPSGGTNYSIVGTSQLLSVPYALFAAFGGIPGPEGPIGPTGEQGPIGATGAGLTEGSAANEMMHWNGSAWVALNPGVNGQVLTICGGILTWTTGGVCPSVYPPGSVFCVGGATAIVPVINSNTGKTWMDRNLGASQAATSINDFTSYGFLYQWGRRSDGHQCRTSSTISVLSSVDQPLHNSFIASSNDPYDWRSPQNTELWQGVNGVNNPCPSGYRLPTQAEIYEERLSWSSNDITGAFNSPLKWVASGFRHYYGDISAAGLSGGCWSSTVNGTESWRLFFQDDDANLAHRYRGRGYSVRCIKD